MHPSCWEISIGWDRRIYLTLGLIGSGASLFTSWKNDAALRQKLRQMRQKWHEGLVNRSVERETEYISYGVDLRFIFTYVTHFSCILFE